MESMVIETSIKQKGHNSVRFEIVQNQEQMLDAISIRAIVYMEDEGLAARMAFDGNDFQATHVVGYSGDEPFAAIRIRWFNGFAKLERMAMRKAYRSPRVLKSFLDYVFEHVARKGYPIALTHAAPVYARLWCKLFRFEQVNHKAPAYFTCHEGPLFELVKHLEVPENAITAETDVQVLYRIEGAWDTPVRYEVSAE
jgi:hypothetical protein